MHEKFIARQPIFDDKLKLFGYELLFRASSENVFRPYKGASDSLIVDSTMLFGLQTLTGHAKAFINLDLVALQRGTARLLPPDQVVFEILESITPSQEVVQLCAELCNEALKPFKAHAILCGNSGTQICGIICRTRFRSNGLSSRNTIES